MNAIFHRTSIRKYTDKPVEPEKLELLLRAAMAAPSACNQQPWEFVVVTDRALISRLAKLTPYTGPCARAPVVIVPCARRDCQLPPFADIDLSAAVENLLLEADELGLGAVWMGVAPMAQRAEEAARLLALPEQLRVFCLVACGYPDQVKQQQNRFDPARVHYRR